MKKHGIVLLIFAFLLCESCLIAQTKHTYKSNGTTYYYNETYKTTGEPKVDRSSSAKGEFLQSKGYKKVPSGYQVDHVIPLSEGGPDKPSNMQLISTDQHKIKTAQERASNSTNSTYRAPTYKSNATYKNSNSYSMPDYSNSREKTGYTGSKVGQYSINSKGNKPYVKGK